jgi:hypothetical protein
LTVEEKKISENKQSSIAVQQPSIVSNNILQSQPSTVPAKNLNNLTMENQNQKCPITQSKLELIAQPASEQFKEIVKASRADDNSRQIDKTADGINISNDQNAANKIEIIRASPMKQEKRDEEKSNSKLLNNNKENNRINSIDFSNNNNNNINVSNNVIRDVKSEGPNKQIEKVNETKTLKLKKSEEFLNVRDIEPELIEIINFNKVDNNNEINKSNSFQSLSAFEATNQNSNNNKNANKERELEENSEEKLRIVAKVRKNSKMLNINNNFQRAASPFLENSPGKTKKKKGIKLRFLLDESTTTDMLYQKSHTVRICFFSYLKKKTLKLPIFY